MEHHLKHWDCVRLLGHRVGRAGHHNPNGNPTENDSRNFIRQGCHRSFRNRLRQDLAYLLPIFEKLDMNIRGTQAIILTPTHELAAQVYHQAELLQENAGIAAGCVLLIGAAGIGRQLEKLKAKPRIVVGSVGRILDLICKKKIQAHLVRTIVLDEGDRLMDDGNVEDVAAVIKTTLKERQIVLLSASVSGEARAKAAAMMKADAVDFEARKRRHCPQGHPSLLYPLRARRKIRQSP